MPQQAAGRTGEQCPSCGSEMVLLDDGGPLALAECRACGHRETRDDINRPADRGGAE